MKIIVLLTLLVSSLSSPLEAEHYITALFEETILKISPDSNPELCTKSLKAIKETYQAKASNQTSSLFEDFPLLFEILESSNVTSTCAAPIQVFLDKYSTCFTKESILKNLHTYSFNLIESIANVIYHIRINKIDAQLGLFLVESFRMLCGEGDPSIRRLPSPFDPTKIVPFNATKFSKEFLPQFFKGQNTNFTKDSTPCIVSLFEFYAREEEGTGYELLKVVEKCAPLGKYLDDLKTIADDLIEREKTVEVGLKILRYAGDYRMSIIEGLNSCLYGQYSKCASKVAHVAWTLRRMIFDGLAEKGSWGSSSV